MNICKFLVAGLEQKCEVMLIYNEIEQSNIAKFYSDILTPLKSTKLPEPKTLIRLKN